MELNKIYNENCLDTMARMPEGFIDLTVTSPPYDNLREYKGFEFDFKAVISSLFRVTKSGGIVVWIVADATINGSETGTSFQQALFAKDCGFCLHDTMIWQKDGSPFPDKTRYYQNFEYMFIFKKPGAAHTFNVLADRKNKKHGQAIIGTDREADGTTRIRWGKQHKELCDFSGPRFNVWSINAEKTDLRTLHPAMFPEKLAADHIHSWSNPGDLVYDPFSGSGTTAKMAATYGRKFIGSEISAEYCRIAEARLLPILTQTKLFA